MVAKTETYTVNRTGFFYIQGVSTDLSSQLWNKYFHDEKSILCFDSLDCNMPYTSDMTSIITGLRHENGDGLYCVITVDLPSGQVSFESDIAGGVPLFWLSKGGITIAASGLELLIDLAKNLGIKLTPNLNAFSELLIASYIYTETQTGVEDVNMLPPKSRLTINRNNGKVEVLKTAPDFTYSDEELKWGTAKETFKNGLHEGAARYKGKKVACLLSGGADSRIIALSAVKSGASVDFYTFGQSTVNISDFYVSSHIGYRLGKKVHCFSTSASDFIKNWKQACSNANWINDSVWWAGRIPSEMFSALKEYDVILRGDGDGIYGWKTPVANVSDILHRLEISNISAVKRYYKYFMEPDGVFGPAEISRKELVDKYRGSKNNLRDLTNILYQKIREPRGIAPGIWHFSGLAAIDAPLLWEKPLYVAAMIPKDKRYDKQIIFDVLKTYDKVRDVPFSQGGSWDNQLEFYCSGVWEELIDYIKDHSPFPVNSDELCRDYIKPSAIDGNGRSPCRQVFQKMKQHLLGSDLGRITAFKYFSNLTHSSIAERLVVRLALISNLCETISSKKTTDIVKLS